MYKSGQQSMRVAVYGTKHDASLFEELLKEASQFEPLGTIGDTMIDTACLNIPKARNTIYIYFILVTQKRPLSMIMRQHHLSDWLQKVLSA